MAINKKLIHFKSKAAFEEQLAANNILDTSIVFIQDAKEIWTHGLYYNCDDPDLSKYVTKEELDILLNGIKKGNAGDAILVNKSTLEFVAVNPSDLSSYPSSDYEPIGVVVIPASHNVYGTGECGVMALKSASKNTPDIGEAAYTSAMYWGQLNNNTEISDFEGVSCYDTTWNSIQFIRSGNLPSDQDSFGSKLKNPNGDPYSWYYRDNDNHCPSPYNKDGSFNTDYSNTEIGLNCLGDFNGKRNTEILCKLATAQSDWKTSATIVDDYNSGYSPAACSCWRYHTLGTNQGDWYLPTCAEIGYTCVRFKLINNTISILSSLYNKTFLQLNKTTQNWSSNERGKTYAISYYYGDCEVGGASDKNYKRYVRPFTRLNLSTSGFYDELNKKVDKTTTINGHDLSSNVTLTKEDIGLNNVDNTSDLDKPVSTATQTALNTLSSSVDSKIANQIAEVVANAPEDLNTLKEIADWISTHADSAATMNSQIQANKEAIDNAVKKSGDTMSGTLTISSNGGGNQLVINNTAGGETFFWLQSDGVNKGAFTTEQSDYGTCIFNAIGSDYLGIKNNGTPHFNGNTIWHAGNDGPDSGLDADTLDGYGYSDFESRFFTQIDTTQLDENTWYPVTMGLPNSEQIRIRIEGCTEAPGSWNGRQDKKMALILDYTVNGSHWGWTMPTRVVYRWEAGAGTVANAVCGLGLMINSGTEYVFVRGGAKYNFYLSYFIRPILRTSAYTIREQTIQPTTTQPELIVRNNALITDKVAAASIADTVNDNAITEAKLSEELRNTIKDLQTRLTNLENNSKLIQA